MHRACQACTGIDAQGEGAPLRPTPPIGKPHPHTAQLPSSCNMSRSWPSASRRSAAWRDSDTRCSSPSTSASAAAGPPPPPPSPAAPAGKRDAHVCRTLQQLAVSALERRRLAAAAARANGARGGRRRAWRGCRPELWINASRITLRRSPFWPPNRPRSMAACDLCRLFPHAARWLVAFSHMTVPIQWRASINIRVIVVGRRASRGQGGRRRSARRPARTSWVVALCQATACWQHCRTHLIASPRTAKRAWEGKLSAGRRALPG